jgi:hypothetical protein
MTAVFSVDVAECRRLMGQDKAATVKNVEVFKQIIFPQIR